MDVEGFTPRPPVKEDFVEFAEYLETVVNDAPPETLKGLAMAFDKARKRAWFLHFQAFPKEKHCACCPTNKGLRGYELD